MKKTKAFYLLLALVAMVGCKNNNLSSLRFSNRKAIGFWKRIQSKILYEQKEFDYSKHRGGTFYLNYNEFGVKKRCYSNFSNLKIGLIKTTY